MGIGQLDWQQRGRPGTFFVRSRNEWRPIDGVDMQRAVVCRPGYLPTVKHHDDHRVKQDIATRVDRHSNLVGGRVYGICFGSVRCFRTNRTHGTLKWTECVFDRSSPLCLGHTQSSQSPEKSQHCHLYTDKVPLLPMIKCQQTSPQSKHGPSHTPNIMQ